MRAKLILIIRKILDVEFFSPVIRERVLDSFRKPKFLLFIVDQVKILLENAGALFSWKVAHYDYRFLSVVLLPQPS